MTPDELEFPLVRFLRGFLDKLTDDERLELFRHYCRYCGSVNPQCQCWNDD